MIGRLINYPVLKPCRLRCWCFRFWSHKEARRASRTGREPVEAGLPTQAPVGQKATQGFCSSLACMKPQNPAYKCSRVNKQFVRISATLRPTRSPQHTENVPILSRRTNDTLTHATFSFIYIIDTYIYIYIYPSHNKYNIHIYI